MARKDLLVVCLLFLISISFAAKGQGEVHNTKVTRVLSMNGPNIKQVTSIEIKNDSKEPVSEYILLVPNDHLDNIVNLDVSTKEKKLEVTRHTGSEVPTQYTAFKVKFDTPIPAGKDERITVSEEHVNRKRAFPSKMKINDTPRVRVIDDAYYPSLYFTKKMKSTFEVGESATVIKATEIEKGEVRGKSIKYGVYRDIEPLKTHPIYIHVDYMDPLPVFTEVKRVITLSHWKGINIDEEYRLVNNIATLQGEFSRLDYSPWKVKYSINNLDCELPQYTKDLYYTDEIGNITTSNAYRGAKNVHFTIEPRFPLMGGWKTYWKQGYVLPREKHITQNSGDSFTFQINLSHPYNDIVAEDFSVSIVLPEGATDIHFDDPIGFDSIQQSTVYDYLDLIGRTSFTMSKKNVMEKYHDKTITVTYKLSAFDHYRKPALVCIYMFVLLFLAMLSYRCTSERSSKVKEE